jgi:pimeloyl-ACP methyl ester carboxylesterase
MQKFGYTRCAFSVATALALSMNGACASARVGADHASTTIDSATESEVSILSGGYTLQGTWHNTAGARVAAVLLQGSGQTDRDSTTPPERTTTGKESKDFKDVAAALAQAGISSLRFDKRGIREALGTPPSLTVWKTISRDLLLQDARSAIAWARAQGFERVMLLGHSEGTSLALQLAAEPQTASQIHSLVLLGTVGEPFKQTMHYQFVDSQITLAFSFDKNADEFVEPAEVPPEMADGLPIAALDADKDGKMSRAELATVLESQYQSFLAAVDSDTTGELIIGHPAVWWRQMFAAASPLEHASGIAVPVLIMHGERDSQLAFEANALPLYETFKRRGVDVTIKRYPTYGHGLAPPGDNAALGPIEPDVLEDLRGWVLAHTR